MLNGGPVLIIRPDHECCEGLVATLRKHNLPSQRCSAWGAARDLLCQQRFEAVLCSDNLRDVTYTHVIESVKPLPVIVLSRLAEWSPYLKALHAGAFDYIAWPPQAEEVERILRHALTESLRLRGREAAIPVA